MLHDWEKLSAAEKSSILDGFRDNAVYGGPYHAEFSPTDACNYECFFCSTAFVDRKRRLGWPRLEAVMMDLIGGGLKSVRLSGGGEPLIYPQMTPFLDLCLAHRISVSNVTTNGYKLTPEIIDRLLRLDTAEIIVSFNDLEPEDYARTNGTTERAYDVVIENVRNLMAERARRGLTRPNVVLQLMLWKSNHDRIEKGYDLGLELGVDNIYIRDMWGLEPEQKMSPSELTVAGREMSRLIDRDAERGKLIMSFANEKILPDHPTFREQMDIKVEKAAQGAVEDPERDEYCYIAWYSTVIWGSGNVYPCCFLAGLEGYPPLGNVGEASFREIWEGPAYRKLRTELRDIAIHGGRFEKGEEHCYTQEACAMRDACPVVGGMADREFYQEGLGALREIRRRPGVAVRSMAEKLMTRRPFMGGVR